MEKQIIELETKVAYQEVSIQELTQTVFAMQKQINELENCCRVLKERMQEVAVSISRDFDGEEKPPHY